MKKFFMVLAFILVTFPSMILLSACGNTNASYNLKVEEVTGINITPEGGDVEKITSSFKDSTINVEVRNDYDASNLKVFVNDAEVTLTANENYDATKLDNTNYQVAYTFKMGEVNKDVTIKSEGLVEKTVNFTFKYDADSTMTTPQKEYANDITIGGKTLKALTSSTETASFSASEVLGGKVVVNTYDYHMYSVNTSDDTVYSPFIIKSVNGTAKTADTVATANDKDTNYYIDIAADIAAGRIKTNNEIVVDCSTIHYSTFEIVNTQPSTAIAFTKTSIAYGSNDKFTLVLDKTRGFNFNNFKLQVGNYTINESNFTIISNTDDQTVYEYNLLSGLRTVPADYNKNSSTKLVIKYFGVSAPTAQDVLDANNLAICNIVNNSVLDASVIGAYYSNPTAGSYYVDNSTLYNVALKTADENLDDTKTFSLRIGNDSVNVLNVFGLTTPINLKQASTNNETQEKYFIYVTNSGYIVTFTFNDTLPEDDYITSISQIDSILISGISGSTTVEVMQYANV